MAIVDHIAGCGCVVRVAHRRPLRPISHSNPHICRSLRVDAARRDAEKAEAAYKRATSAQEAVATAKSELASATKAFTEAKNQLDKLPSTAQAGTPLFFERQAAIRALDKVNKQQVLPAEAALERATKLLGNLSAKKVALLKTAWKDAEAVLVGKLAKLEGLLGKVDKLKHEIASILLDEGLGQLLSSLLTLYEYKSLVDEQRASGALYFVACGGDVKGPFCQ